MPPHVQYREPQQTFTASGYQPLQATVRWYAQARLTKTRHERRLGPSGSITPPGWLRGDCPSHHNRGHLIGNAVGGSATESKNLVTLTAGTNHPIPAVLLCRSDVGGLPEAPRNRKGCVAL
jgi:hypothetical protein